MLKFLHNKIKGKKDRRLYAQIENKEKTTLYLQMIIYRDKSQRNWGGGDLTRLSDFSKVARFKVCLRTMNERLHTKF